MFDLLGIDGTAFVVSDLLAGIMTGLMPLSLELCRGGGRFLGIVVTHVGDFFGEM
jgi:hypothetical protein